MKDNGQGYVFVKGSLLVEVLVKALEAVEVRGKSPFFNYFLFWQNITFLKDSFNTTLYLLDLIGF